LEQADILRDLNNLLEREITVKGQGYFIKNETEGITGKLAQA